MQVVNMGFENKDIIIVERHGEPWFNLKNICDALGHKNTYQAERNHCDQEGVTWFDVEVKKGKKHQKFVSEPNLYSLIFSSKIPKAVEFKKWVFNEVLPKIRKTGQYKISDSLKQKSTKARNGLTGAWKENGVSKPSEYARLTLEEYRSLGFDNDKRKKDLNRGELLALTALEAMEELNLFINPQDGFNGCRDSLKSTAKKIPVKQNEILPG